VLVSYVTVSAKTCNVTSLPGQVLQPKLSWENGARFRHHQHTQTKEECQQGCCGTERCDTILYTGSKVDKKGDNCFYFDCHSLCIFRNSTTQESDFSVAVLSTSAHVDLPDFSNIFVSSKPKANVQKDNSTVSHHAVDNPVERQKVTTPTNSTKSAENKVKPETKAPTTQKPSEDSQVPAKAPENTVKDTTLKDSTVKPDTPAKNKTVDTAAVNNKSDKTAPTPASSPNVNEAVTVKDNDEKPKKSDNTPAPKPAQPAPAKSPVKETAAKKEGETPTEKTKPKLPNEVPAVTDKAKDNTVKTETETSDKDQKTENEEKEKEKPAPAVVDVSKANNETKAATNVSVKVDIHNIDSKESDTYTNKDIVFWVAVVGGSTLIIIGLVIVIRYYGNKRRRLYSSLTDDYLINGMYSI